MDIKLNQRIKKLRIEHGYKSQQSFADALFVDRSLVKSWEREKNPVLPRLDSLLEICKLFKCDLDYLIGRIEKPTHDIEFIHKETGLSTEAIRKLNMIKQNLVDIIMISKMIEHPDLEYLLDRIYKLIFGDKEEVAKYHKALSEMMKEESNRKYLQFTIVEDYFPIIHEVLKIDDEKSIDSIIRYQISDKMLAMIDDIKNGKIGGPYQ